MFIVIKNDSKPETALDHDGEEHPPKVAELYHRECDAREVAVRFGGRVCDELDYFG